MIRKIIQGATSLRMQLVASVFLWISPALLLTYLVNQDWFWRYAPPWLREYATSVPWESFFVGLLALIAAWYGGEHFILRQIRILTATVVRVSKGDLHARTGLKKAEGELGHLAEKFDEMASSLEKRQAERDEADRKLLNRAMQQTAVSAVGQCALTNKGLDVIYEQAVYRIAEMFSAEYAILFQRQPDGTLLPLAAYGFKLPLAAEPGAVGDEKSQFHWTAETGEVTVVSDCRSDTSFSKSPLLTRLGATSSVAVAIPTQHKPFGILTAHTKRPRIFSPDEIQFLLAIANVVGMAAERIRAEKESGKLAAFVQENPNAAMELSTTGKVTYFNEAAEQLAQSAGQQHPEQILPADLRKIIAECLATGRGQTDITSVINNQTFAWSFHPVQSSGIVHCYGENISTRISLEAQLLQSEKMKTFGQFAAGIAHDFNNMLTIIQGHTSKLLTNESLPADVKESLIQVYAAGDRAADLTRQLLMTSRKNVMQPKLLDLREVVGSTSKMLNRLLGETIQLHFQQPSTLPLVYADQSMIEQVVMNLASNARDAMPDGGTLTINISEIHVTNEDIGRHPEATTGDFVLLTVTDTGCGMDNATRLRIFEPFFTTKDIGKGTGLGLATVFNVIRQHNGWIEVQSEPGSGATFYIFLPASMNTAGESIAPAPRLAAPVAGGSECILVVEDEDLLRELACQILEERGYRTLQASSGREALGIWEKHHQEISLLLTDMVMPEGVSGIKLAEHLLQSEPRLKIVIMSGYTAEEISPDWLTRHNISFIQKPYGHVELASIIRKSLDQKN